MSDMNVVDFVHTPEGKNLPPDIEDLVSKPGMRFSVREDYPAEWRNMPVITIDIDGRGTSYNKRYGEVYCELPEPVVRGGIEHPKGTKLTFKLEDLRVDGSTY